MHLHNITPTCGSIPRPKKRKSERAMTALLNMNKLDIAALQQAYDG
jgi:hypothetical protein